MQMPMGLYRLKAEEFPIYLVAMFTALMLNVLLELMSLESCAGGTLSRMYMDAPSPGLPCLTL